MEESSFPTLSRALSVGELVGAYRITGFIGAGGMGEVYRASDTKLDREVAVKILPMAFRANEDRLRRFAQEAKTMSRINHPNVVSIFDADEHEGRPYIVTELLEGETLRTTLRNEATMTVRRALDIATQISKGLAAAHDKGIVHRDLKPANIFVTRDGHVKILDFGLAKLIHPEWEANPTEAETISAVSLPGTVLGSAGYMSPEQVEARSVDHRSDIFSFGAILYEMLTGRRAFSGGSVPATLGAILKEDPPDVTDARPDIPPALAALVRRCLEKSPDHRFQSARDLTFALEELSTRSDVSVGSTTLRAIRNAATNVSKRPAFGMAAVILLTVTIASLATKPSESAQPRTASAPNFRLSRLTSSGRASTAVAVSADGRYALYSVEGENALRLVHLPTRSETKIATPAPVTRCRFTPDGSYIYYERWNGDSAALYRLPIFGGTEQKIVAPLHTGSFSISEDGSQISFIRWHGEGSSLWSSAPDGSNAREILKKPDSLFMDCAWQESASLWCSVFKRQKYLLAKIDAVSGREETLDDSLALLGLEYARGHFIGTAEAGSNSQLFRIDPATREHQRITNDLSDYLYPDASQDGRTIAALSINNIINLWSFPVSDPAKLRQITSGMNRRDGSWGVRTTREGWIVWTSVAAGSVDLWIAESDGSNPRRLTLDDTQDESWPDVSPDGKTVVYVRGKATAPELGTELWRVNIDGSEPSPLPNSRGGKLPRFSADGRSVFFDRTDRIYELSLADGRTRQVSSRAAYGAAPSPDGRSLLVNVRTEKGATYELWSLDGALLRSFGHHGAKRWKPDGTAFVFLKGGKVWIQRLAKEKPELLLALDDGTTAAYGVEWTPDGKEIIFARHKRQIDVTLLEEMQ